MKYFLKYSYYIIISITFTTIISFITEGIRIELFPIILINLYMLRIIDDYLDYEVDKKEKLLSKNILKNVAIILGVIFIILNVIFYKYYGLIAFIILIYILIQNKYEILKIFLLLITSVIYISMYTNINNASIIIYLFISLILSIIYYVYKRSKKK